MLSETNDIHVLILTKGDADGVDRSEETQAALAGVGDREVTILSFLDGSLLPTAQTVREVESRIHIHRIDTVLTMTRWDTHQDHRAVESIVFAACRRMPITIIGYHVISSTPAFPVNLIVDISEVLERKLEALKCHHSQSHKAYFQFDWLRQWHREKMATAVGLGYVELFHIYHVFWGSKNPTCDEAEFDPER